MTERDGTPHFLWNSSHPIDYCYSVFSCPLGFGAWEFSTCAEALPPLPPRTLEGWGTIKKKQHRVAVCGNPRQDSPVHNAKQSGNGWDIEMRGKTLHLEETHFAGAEGQWDALDQEGWDRHATIYWQLR